MTELELTSLLFQLADLGITGIKVKYDGAGDSGAIEWIGYTTKPCETPEDVDDNVDDWAVEWNLAKFDQDAYTAIESFAYDILNNHVRITETEDYFHDGSLLDEVKEK